MPNPEDDPEPPKQEVSYRLWGGGCRLDRLRLSPANRTRECRLARGLIEEQAGAVVMLLSPGSPQLSGGLKLEDLSQPAEPLSVSAGMAREWRI